MKLGAINLHSSSLRFDFLLLLFTFRSSLGLGSTLLLQLILIVAGYLVM